MNKIYITILLLILILTSCNNNKTKEAEVERSMYVWTSLTRFAYKDNKFLTDNNIKNIYIRFFDVEWNTIHGEIPIAELKFKGYIDSVNIIPVVYIKNEVLKNIDTKDIDEFAKKLHFKIYQINDEYFWDKILQEVQFDCDWTETTQNKYFKLLTALKSEFEGIDISVTIRLHQIKYQAQTGVPPADKGVLMYYNMGDFQNENEKNSILNNQIGESYISENQDYPLELSLALPVFSWCVWYKWSYDGENYDYQFHKLLTSINSQNINELNFIEKSRDYDAPENLYQITKDTVYSGNYFRYGERLKLEQPSELDGITVSHETIYYWLQNGEGNKKGYWK